GREFNAFDGPDTLPVAIVDERFADKRWPRQDPIGKRVRFSRSDSSDAPYTTVIGVAANVHLDDLKSEDRENVYFSSLQYPVNNTVRFVMGTASNPASVMKFARDELQRIDPDQPLFNIRILEDLVGQSIWIDRVLLDLFGFFAGIALLLAVVGIYGVVQF